MAGDADVHILSGFGVRVASTLATCMSRHSLIVKRQHSRLIMQAAFDCARRLVWFGVIVTPCLAAEPPDWYHREGELRGSLRSASSLPLYDADPGHLWNRLFAVFYIRPSELPSRPEYPEDSTKLDEWDRKLRDGKLPLGRAVKRFEGGDTMSFLAWPRTRYFSEPETFARRHAAGGIPDFARRTADRRSTQACRFPA